MAKKLKFNIDISVNKVLSETEEQLLRIALGQAVKTVLGPSKSGFVLIHSTPIERAVKEILAPIRMQRRDEKEYTDE